MKYKTTYPFHSVEEKDLTSEKYPQKRIPGYKLAFIDKEFMLRHELRSTRLQLEFLKAEMQQLEQHIESTIVIFGSSRIPAQEDAAMALRAAEKQLKKAPNNTTYQQALTRAQRDFEKSLYYEEARNLAWMISKVSQAKRHRNFVVVTGGGPGIMEAANRGAYDAKAKSIGLNIFLPTEEGANPYITPELNFQFHYFAIRKMHFLIRARAMVFFPGGYGTLDELFEVLTLMQTRKIKRVPILLFGKNYWTRVINFDVLVEEGAISPEDVNFFQYVDKASDAWKIIQAFYQITPTKNGV